MALGESKCFGKSRQRHRTKGSMFKTPSAAMRQSQKNGTRRGCGTHQDSLICREYKKTALLSLHETGIPPLNTRERNKTKFLF